jgi:hypothetical protein
MQMRGNVAPPFAPEQARHGRLGIWGGDQERPAWHQEIPAPPDELARLVEVFDQIHGDDRVEAFGREAGLLDGPLADVQSEPVRVGHRRTRQLEAGDVPARIARLRHQETMAAPYVQHPSDIEALLEQAQQPSSRPPAPSFFVEVNVVSHSGIARGYELWRGKLVRLHGAAALADI